MTKFNKGMSEADQVLDDNYKMSWELCFYKYIKKNYKYIFML